MAPEATAQAAPEATAEAAPEVAAEAAPEATAEAAPEVAPEPAPEATAEPAPEATAEPAPEATAEPAPEATAKASPEATAEAAPEATAEAAPEVAAEAATADATTDDATAAGPEAPAGELPRSRPVTPVTPRRTPRRPASRSGTFRAHCIAICPELMKTAEISAAGQTACAMRSPWSERRLHRTRPIGRLISCCAQEIHGRLAGQWRGLITFAPGDRIPWLRRLVTFAPGDRMHLIGIWHFNPLKITASIQSITLSTTDLPVYTYVSHASAEAHLAHRS